MPTDALGGLCPDCQGKETVRTNATDAWGVENRCQKCGARSSESLSDGLCPQCLMEAMRALKQPTPASSLQAEAVLATARRGFGDYELLEEIAHGGMGVVYKARQVSLNRTVAVKMIRADRLAREEDIKRFYTEAQAAANLQHPNIVAIHEVGEEAGQPFFSMDYVEGESLASLVQERPLAPRQAATYVHAIAQTIHFAHQRGILHRDLKPSNVLIDRQDKVRVTDFGLAKVMTGDSQLTMSGTIMGSPSYMSPEQAEGKVHAVTVRSDVYALGTILYELVCGRPPFKADSTMETLRQVLETEPVSPRWLNPRLPRDLETICLKCLEKNPARRYATAQEFADELARFLNDEPILARPVGPAGRLWRWCRRKPALATVGAVAAVLLGVVAVGSPIAAYRLNAARLLAQQRELKARRNAYAADMAVVQEAIGRRNYGYALQLLRAHRPAVGETDLRGWEWRHFWDLCRSDETATLTRNGPAPTTLRVSPSGKWLVSASQSGAIKLRNMLEGREALALTNMGDIVAFSPDERWLLMARRSGRVWFWSLDNLSEVGPALESSNMVQVLACLPDGQRFVTVGDGKLRVWDLTTRRQIEEHKVPAGTRVVASSDAGKVAATTDHRHIVLWERGVETNRVFDTQNIFAGHAMPFSFSPDGRLLASAVSLLSGAQFTVQIWDVASGRQITNYAAHIDYITSLTFSPDGQHVATTGYDQVTEVWETRSWRNAAVLRGHLKNVLAAAFFPDQRRLVTSGEDETLKLWDWARPISKKNRVTLPEAATSELISGGRDSEYFGCASPEHSILALGTPAGKGVLVDAVRGRIAREFAFTEGPVTKVAAGPQAAILAFANRLGSVSLWDTRSASNLCTFELSSTQSVHQLAFAPNGRWLVASGSNGLFRLWDVPARVELEAWRDKTTHVATLLFSPDSAILANGHRSGRIRLWDVGTAQLVFELSGHTYGMNRLAFSLDGKRLASTGWDASVRVWDLPARREIARFRGSRSSYFRVGFSPDGTRLFVNEWDEAILFDIEAQRQVARLKSFMPVFLDEDTVLGLSQNEMWHWRPPRLAEIDAAEVRLQ